MTQTETLAIRDYCAENIVGIALSSERRVLLFGAPGIGKSTLAAELACQLGKAGRPAWCICADPGGPTFGVPGAVCIGEWQGGHWGLVDLEALRSLDAGRFAYPRDRIPAPCHESASGQGRCQRSRGPPSQ